MLRATLSLVVIVAVLGVTTPALAGACPGCAAIKAKGQGFCVACDKGRMFGVDLTSKKLHDALDGRKIDTAKMKCTGCKAAANDDSVCSHCNVGMAGGMAYHSRVAHTLAKGKAMSAGKVSGCTSCKSARKSHGFCTACDVGFVADRAFKGKKQHDAAADAHKILVKAADKAQKCEPCAVAMVTDGKCKHCKVSFKDGRKVTQ